MRDMGKPGPDPKVSDEEILAALRNRNPPLAVAGDIADVVGLSRIRSAQRLEMLEEAGEVEKAIVGEETIIYWLPPTVSWR